MTKIDLEQAREVFDIAFVEHDRFTPLSVRDWDGASIAALKAYESNIAAQMEAAEKSGPGHVIDTTTPGTPTIEKCLFQDIVRAFQAAVKQA